MAGDAAAEMPTPAPQRIVHLDMVRNARALIVLRNQARELIRQAALLKDEQAYVCRRFDLELRRAREVAVQSRVFLAETGKPSRYR